MSSRNMKQFILVFSDLFLVVLSYFLAWSVRFDFSLPLDNYRMICFGLPFIIPIKLIFFTAFNLYRGIWRFASFRDALNILYSCVLSEISLAFILLMLFRFDGFPRSVILLDFIFSFLLIASFRAAIRVRKRNSFCAYSKKQDQDPKRIIILGAGRGADTVLRELSFSPDLNLKPMGLLDDDPLKQGRFLQGVKVLGNISELGRFCDQFDEILIAIPSVKGHQMRRIIECCIHTGKPYRTLPHIGEILNGRTSIKASRNLTIDDLVGRQEVRINPVKIKDQIQGRNILVTGAGGSIGSELVRSLWKFNPRTLGLLDLSEFNLFNIESECARMGSIHFKSYLADIRDRNLLDQVFSEFKPDVVYHAAALKHVPMQEHFPEEAVKTNIFGTHNVLMACAGRQVQKLIFVSTDKAVNPTNVMGATKRVGELLIKSHRSSSTQCLAVRFGNVIGSSGSVINTFQEQIRRGGPLTVTHPDITRFFMTIPEAAQLIIQAGAVGRGGEVFLLQMGEPVRIQDLAKSMIRFFGHEPGLDIPIHISGLRPGEKLFEELTYEDESLEPTCHDRIVCLRNGNGHCPGLLSKMRLLQFFVKNRDRDTIKMILKEMVPEYELFSEPNMILPLNEKQERTFA